MASQILSIVSLFIGGVLLSAVAVIVAIIGRSKFMRAAANQSDQNAIAALRRSANLAIAMSVLALALNAVYLVLFYPIFLEAMQSGDLLTMFSSESQPSASTSSGSGIFG